MSFIGHARVQHELERLVELSEIPQSFLFCGPRHVGKRTVAEWFARQLIAASHPNGVEQNLLVLEPAQLVSAKRVREQLISVESVREAQKFLSFSPVAAKRRVLIIDGAEKLGTGAANALLKILEEPPAKSVLILITAEPASLLPTILSRVVNFYFRPVEGGLIQQGVREASLLPQFFVDLGLPGVVMEAVTLKEEFQAKKDTLRQLFQLSKLSLHERLILAETLAKDEKLARDVLEIWCVGLVFQVRSKSFGVALHYSFLEHVLETLRLLSRGEGAPRPLLEKLFFSL